MNFRENPSQTNLPENFELQSAQIPVTSFRGLIIAIIAAVISAIAYQILPYGHYPNAGLTILLFVAILWFTEAVHITVTALTVPLLAIFFKIPDMGTKEAFAGFSDPIIYVFFGGFALAAAMHVQRLDRKIAMLVISLSRGNMLAAVMMVFAVTTGLSMWISNTATAAMMLPLAMGLMGHVDKEKDRKTYVFVLLGIAYCASIGGLGTLVGSPPNAIAAKALNLDFAGWMKHGLPMMLVLLPLMLFSLFVVLKPNFAEKVDLQQKEDIPWTLHRVITVIIFVVTALCWIFGGDLGKATGIKSIDSFIAMVAAVAVAASFGHASPLVIILVVAAFIIFLTEFTSNTASAALLVPVFATIAAKMGMNQEVLVLIIGIGASCAFMLPVATPPNAIVFGSGLIKQKEMMQVGFLLNILSIIVVSAWAYFFLT